jgi:hypothetical protein
MTAARAGRGVRYTAAGIVIAAVAVAAGVWVANRPQIEKADGPIPEAISPFGPVTRAQLVFRWAIPTDHAPVQVEVLDELASSAAVWKSEPTSGDSLRPPAEVVDRWPLADLLWRPVAVPASGASRPGELAAFSLLP